MPIVALKCPHCGGDLTFENSRKFGFCEFCGTKIMIQQEIKNITNITNNVSDLDRVKSNRFKQSIRTHLDENRYNEAWELIKQLGEIDDSDPDYYLLSIECRYRESFNSPLLIACNRIRQKSALETIEGDFERYVMYSADKRTLAEIIDSFGLPRYDYKRFAKEAAWKTAEAEAGSGIRMQYSGPHYRCDKTPKKIVSDDYMRHWAFKASQTIANAAPYRYCLADICIIMQFDPIAYGMLLRVRPEYGVATILQYYVRVRKDSYVGVDGISVSGWNPGVIVDPMFKDKDHFFVLNPQTIENYRRSKSGRKFFKGFLKKQPDDEKQRLYDENLEMEIRAMTDYYQKSCQYIFKSRSDDVMNRIPKWFVNYCEKK